MNILRYLFLESWRILALSAVAGIVSGLAGAGIAKIISDAATDTTRIAAGALTFFGLCVVFLLSKAGAEISLMHLVQTVILRLRIDLSRKMLATPLKTLQGMGKAELLAIMTNDISAFVQAFQMLPMAFGNTIIVVACCGYLLWLSWQVFVFFAATLLVCLVAYHFAERYPLRQMVKLRQQLDVLYEHFRNLIEGSRELQLNARRGQTFVNEFIGPDAHKFKRFFIGTMTGYTCVSNLGLVLFYVVIGALLFVVPAWLPQQGGILVTFSLILLFLLRPISDLMFSLPILRQAAISLEKIQQLEGALTEPTDISPESSVLFGASPRTLELHQVRHRYEEPDGSRAFMLGPVDLVVQRGEILFIVGANGSGKTTLAMLLLGFYAPEAGSIRLNGVPVTSENLSAYRQHFSAVFADFHLFEQLLDTESDELRCRAAHYLKRLDMARKVTVEGRKFSTIKLSGGQRKRLALVSAFLEDRPIYLFDEWAADQDPAFKRVFYAELLPELKARGKTVIIITHDDAYFQYADRIVRLDEGRLRSVKVDHARSRSAGAQFA